MHLLSAPLVSRLLVATCVAVSAVAATESRAQNPAVQDARAKYVESAPAPAGPDFSGFAEAGLLSRLYEGAADASDRSDFLSIHYFHFLNKVMSPEGIGTALPDCLELYDHRLTGQLMSATIGNRSAETLAKDAMRELAELFKGSPSQALGRMVRAGAAKEGAIEGGKADAVRLAQTFGCRHRVVRMVYANLGRLFAGIPLSPPPEVAKRKRLAKLRAESTSQCSRHYGSAGFCACLVGTLKRGRISELAWSALVEDFSRVDEVLLVLEAPRRALQSCYRR